MKDRTARCSVRNFTSESVGFCPADLFFRQIYAALGLGEDGFNHVSPIGLVALFGKTACADRRAFDTVIGNRDGHMGNDGILFDNDTGRRLRPVPLFGQGKVLFYGVDDEEESDMQIMGTVPWANADDSFSTMRHVVRGGTAF